MGKVVGFEAKTFSFEDGKTVSGFYLYTTEERKGVTGTACERTFVSDGKLNGYVPELGDEIIINYNRFGKPQSVVKDASHE